MSVINITVCCMKVKKLLDYINKSGIKESWIKEYKKNEILFYEGQPCNEVSIILDGEVYMTSVINNSDLVYNIFDKYEIFGNNLIFSSLNKYRATVVARKKTKLIKITRHNLDILLNDKNIRDEYLRIIADTTLQDKRRLIILQIPYLEDRVNELLNMNEGVLTIKSIANLAYFLSTTRENLSRLLHEMEESGKIAIHKNYIEVIKK